MKVGHAHLRFPGQGFYIQRLVVTAVDLVNGARHLAELALLGDGRAQGAALFIDKNCDGGLYAVSSTPAFLRQFFQREILAV
ncbi:hypothetical protein D3C85_1245290 [compost metagenome]